MSIKGWKARGRKIETDECSFLQEPWLTTLGYPRWENPSNFVCFKQGKFNRSQKTNN